MKKIIILICLLIPLSTFAQEVKSIELFDLIKMFAPNESDNTSKYSWLTGADENTCIDWTSVGIEDNNKYDFRHGFVIISINMKLFYCLGKKKELCKWDFTLKGERNGYSSYTIKSNRTHFNLEPLPIEELLGNKDYTYKKLKKCDELGLGISFDFYEIKISKKKTIWVKVNWIGKTDSLLIIDCFTKLEEKEMKCITDE